MAKKRIKGRRRSLDMSQIYNNRNFVNAEDERLRQMDMQIRMAIPNAVKREMYIRELIAKLEADIKAEEEK
jgi:hypothetical protein